MTLLALALLLPACASLSDVKPGDGKLMEPKGRSCDEVWEAAYQVAVEHFEILEQDKARGVILAERGVHFTSNGEYVGIFITPPAAGAERYTVEVVNRKKAKYQLTGQAWEGKVLRDIRDVLRGEERP